MKALRNYLDKIKPNFEEGGKFHAFRSVFDGFETFLFVPNTTAKSGTHIHDSIDSKRIMSMVVIALMPALLFGMYNVPRCSGRERPRSPERIPAAASRETVSIWTSSVGLAIFRSNAMPLWSVPLMSPAPRSLRSSSARRNPSLVSHMASRRARDSIFVAH